MTSPIAQMKRLGLETLEELKRELARPDGKIVPIPTPKSTKALAQAILDMAEKDKGLVLSKLEDLIELHQPTQTVEPDTFFVSASNEDIDKIRRIAVPKLESYGINPLTVAVEVFDHGGQIGIAAKHEGRRDSVRVSHQGRTIKNGIEVSVKDIEDAAKSLALRLANRMSDEERERLIAQNGPPMPINRIRKSKGVADWSDYDRELPISGSAIKAGLEN